MAQLGFHRGQGATLIAQGIYEESATAKHMLGERTVVGDRFFRYAQAGATALVAGYVVQNALLGGAGTTFQTNCAVAVAAAINSKRVYITAGTTAQSASLFQDGYAAILDASATAGFMYRIKDNSALATSGTSSYIDLYDELHIALTTSDKVNLITNPYKAVLVQTVSGSITGCPLGVPPIAVTASYYFWLQTGGPAAVFVNDATTNVSAGLGAIIAATTAGTVINDTAALTTPAIGWFTGAWLDANMAVVMLDLAW